MAIFEKFSLYLFISYYIVVIKIMVIEVVLLNIFHQFKNEFLYSGLSREEFLQVKEPVRENNRKNIIAWTILKKDILLPS